MRNNLIQLVVFLVFVSVSIATAARDTYTCLQCHTQTANVATHAIFHTPHGDISNEVTPRKQSLDNVHAVSTVLTNAESKNLACVACHGASSAHQKSPIAMSPDISFGPRWQTDIQKNESMCMGCHKKESLTLWLGSEHKNEDLSCNSCHLLHAKVDAVLHKKSEAALCYSCHSRQRAQAHLPSHHPIAEGKTACSDCHNAHGSITEYLLKEVSLNDACLTCHQEKRGPFLFEHAPAAEDCSTCHEAHGAVNDNLLTVRGPFLCQQCHMASFHPSNAFGGAAVGEANKNVVGKNCLNCHSQVHGSNHPSGAFLTR